MARVSNQANPTQDQAGETTIASMDEAGEVPPEIGDYVLLKKIGTGGMGVVFLARQTSLDRDVALKIIRFQSGSPSELESRFRTEARAASALNHPNVCTIYNFGTTEAQQAYLAMEFVAGATLKELISNGPLPPHEVAKIGLQIAAALTAAHKRGIIHRDIKPANIKINELGLVKVLDFGLAKWFPAPNTTTSDSSVTSMTGQGKVVGTPSYMSPEQALGKRLDARSDLFSLGIVLYEIATGKHPFIGQNVPETIHNIVNLSPHSAHFDLGNLDDKLRPIIERCLQKSPSDRFPGAEQLTAEFEQLVSDRSWAIQLAPRSERDNQVTETQAFSPSLQRHLKGLKREVEKLTQDQFRVLQYLRLLTRVRIAGCAGSGKTLIAAEKAIRLARAGLPTLFLCHSPLLADFVRNLTRSSGATVASFKEWIHDLIGAEPDHPSVAWNNYDEPDDATMEKAFDQILSRPVHYEAVIIDEGQDFRNEWWTLIEATHPNAQGVLYIFHDDRQSLLPHRTTYPIDEPILDLSRNCRNAGRIYELIKHFDNAAPAAEATLAQQGFTRLETYQPGGEQAAITRAMNSAYQEGFLEQSAFLLGGSERAVNSPFHDMTIEIGHQTKWQDEIRNQFERIRAGWKQPKQAPQLPDKDSLKQSLDQLTPNHFPTGSDIALVCRLAKHFKINPALEEVPSVPRTQTFNLWHLQNGTLALKPTRLPNVVRALQQSDWAKGIPKPASYRLTTTPSPTNQGSQKTIPLLDIATFKGLEVDCVFLFLRGNTPQLTQQIYVGVSRARYALYIITDAISARYFPSIPEPKAKE